MHCSKFKMYGNKKDFINSVHPTLRQIGNLSLDEQIEIFFNNMNGTKVFEIIDPNINIISNGLQIEKSHIDLNFKDINLVIHVHCEFDYGLGKIIISSTHWCNLESVEILKKYYMEIMLLKNLIYYYLLIKRFINVLFLILLEKFHQILYQKKINYFKFNNIKNKFLYIFF